MKVGVTLPQFRTDPNGVFEAARAAEEYGLDGVFVFDHLWAIGQPDRPALACWPLLGALAALTRQTSNIALGTLVARVSLAPDAVLAHQFETLARIADTADTADATATRTATRIATGTGASASASAGGPPHRIIAGLGTGDRLSEAENVAYGIPFPPLEERLAQLADCARRTKALGLQTWIGGRSEAVKRVAVETQADALNLWDATPQDVRDAANHPGINAVTWGGTLPDASPRAIGELLHDLEQAGAQWAVCGPSYKDRDPEQAVAAVAEAISLAP